MTVVDFVAVPRNPRNKGFDFIFFVYMAMLTKHQILFMQATIAMSHSALMKTAVDIVEHVCNDICAILIKNVSETVSYHMVVNPTEVYLYDSCDNLTNHIKHHRQSKTDFVAVPRNPRNKGFDFIFFVYIAMLTKHQILFMQATIAMSHSALMTTAVDIVEHVRIDICSVGWLEHVRNDICSVGWLYAPRDMQVQSI